MIGKNSAEFACGQIVYSVKMSQLNYVLQETPYSVNIILRKRFRKELLQNVKEHCEQSTTLNIDEVVVDSIKKKLEHVENENMKLKETIKDKICEIGRLEYENEEFEVNNDKLESEKSKLDDDLEELYR